MAQPQLFRAIQAASTRQRLWMAGGAIGIFLLTLVIGNAFIPQDKAVTREMLGHDFLAFYTAGSFVREGRYHDLYKLDAVKDFEQATSRAAGLEVGKSFGPWWNPPFYALIFQPLARMPYAAALDAWRWVSLAAVLIAIGILTVFVAKAAPQADFSTNPRESGAMPGWRNWGLAPLLIVASMPFIQAISHGQNTYTSLLLLTITVAFWRSGRGLAAGIVGGLLFYKPQLGAVVTAVMVLDLGWGAFAGLALTGSVLLIVTITRMPGAISDYIHLLPANVRWMQVEHLYLWERHVTLKAFWRLLLQGREAGELSIVTRIFTYLSLTAIGAGLGWAVLRTKKLQKAGDDELTPAQRRDRMISATICAMPLLMPFYFDYDLLLLAVPAVLYSVERVSRPTIGEPSGRWITLGWALLFVWLFLNPAIALRTHVNGSVLLLSGLSGMMIRRAGRGEETGQAAAEVCERGLAIAA